MPFDLQPTTDPKGFINIVLAEKGVTAGLTLARIDIRGLTRHSREELLDYLGVAVGDPLHYQTLERVCERLDSCHRFWMHKVDVYLPKPPGRYEEQDTEAWLVIRLVEYEEVPKLGEPLSEVDEVMLRMADWLAKLDQSEYDVVVSCATPETSAHFIASLATNAYCVDVKGSCQFAKALDLSLDHTLLVEPGKLSLFAWGGEEMCVISGLKAPIYSLSLKPSWDHQAGKPSVHFESGLGLRSKEKACSISVNAMPTIRHGRESSTHRFENGVLTLVNDQGVARIDQLTGRLLSFDSDPDATQGVTLHIETARGAFERCAEEVRQRAAPFAVQTEQQHELRNLLSFALRYFVPSQFLAREQDKKLAGLLRQAIESPELIAWLEEQQRESKGKAPGEKTGDGPQEFVIPAPFNLDATETSTTDDVLQQIPALADLSFVRGSWPWTAVREVALSGLLSKERPPTVEGWYEELQRLAKQEQNGPLFHLFLASWMDGHQGLGAKFAQQGLERLDGQFLRNDLAHFTKGDLWGAKAVEKLAQVATQLNEEQRGILLSYPPPIARAPLEAVLTRRAERPEEPPREAVAEAVLEAWRGGWREQVEQELQAIAGPVPIQPPQPENP